MFVKPVIGRRVRDPVKGVFLPESGAEVPNNIFWHRRLKDGDVEICQPEKAVKKAVKENE
ncbi:DUF2635 domain-containing protein [Photorhabdus khanii]|uniref:DUF2635 domain-containing protein n=2 Tax=Photorhabdus khanii TaxID=1004150 RepID=A0A4R4J3Y1_9GAMM|nr:DUF2635 domain-containing protein [Photorhabdus khanii]ETS31056.1 Protein of unknown function (DUF2635) [Photorhabdus khanii NC19]OHV54866.1 hypothetical protein BB987_09100 [Photorhabdus temperata]TDB48228.1 DUF2635 domain-containing protein [Photorhabdus khanii subsp. guanajuatensis]